MVGNNLSAVTRAQQAAAYPLGLAKAFCRGALQQMQLDYCDSLAADSAYPVEDAFPREPRLRSRSPPRGRLHGDQAIKVGAEGAAFAAAGEEGASPTHSVV